MNREGRNVKGAISEDCLVSQGDQCIKQMSLRTV